jgi:hypothetical protein
LGADRIVTPLFLTSQRLLSQHWPAAARLLEPVLGAARGEFTLDDLEELCRDGQAVAGVLYEGERPVMAMVFEFRYYPRRTVLNVIALAGSNLAQVAGTFWPSFVAWAKESGATEIEASCAPAMTRMLRPLGFSHTYDTVRMPC